MKVTLRRYAWFLAMAEELDNRVCRAAYDYNEMLTDKRATNQDRWHDGAIDLDSSDADRIAIEWEVTWAFGGHASGVCRIPVGALFDDGWEDVVKAEADATATRIRARGEAEAKDAERQDRAELARLKAKYEGTEAQGDG